MKQRLVYLIQYLSGLSSLFSDLGSIQSASGAVPAMYQVGNTFSCLIAKLSDASSQSMIEELSALVSGNGPVASLWRQQRSLDWARGKTGGYSRDDYNRYTEDWLAFQKPVVATESGNYYSIMDGLVPNTGRLFQMDSESRGLWFDWRPTPSELTHLMSEWDSLSAAELRFTASDCPQMWNRPDLVSQFGHQMNVTYEVKPISSESGKSLRIRASYGNGMLIETFLRMELRQEREDGTATSPFTPVVAPHPYWKEIVNGTNGWGNPMSPVLGACLGTDLTCTVHSSLEDLTWPGSTGVYLNYTAVRKSIEAFLRANGYNNEATSASALATSDSRALYLWFRDLEAEQGGFKDLPVYNLQDLLGQASLDRYNPVFGSWKTEAQVDLGDSEDPTVRTGKALLMKFSLRNVSGQILAVLQTNDLTEEAVLSFHYKDQQVFAGDNTRLHILDRMAAARLSIASSLKSELDL